MRTNGVSEIISSGGKAINAWVSLDSAYGAEVLSHAGYDSVTVDAQHGMFGRDTVQKILQAISTGPAIPMARPSSMNSAEIGWLLDAGAYGIIAPSIDSPELARSFVEACLYPPLGRRSYGPARGLLYGGPDYPEAANQTIMPWAMIESASAVEHMEEIMSTPGLYGVYLGPNDLALDLGLKPGGMIGVQVAAIAHTIIERAHAHGLAAGIFCANAEEAREWALAGFDLVTPGNDVSLLRTSASMRISTVRADLGSTVGPGGGY